MYQSTTLGSWPTLPLKIAPWLFEREGGEKEIENCHAFALHETSTPIAWLFLKRWSKTIVLSGIKITYVYMLRTFYISFLIFLWRCPVLADLDVIGIAKQYAQLDLPAFALGCLLLIPQSEKREQQIQVNSKFCVLSVQGNAFKCVMFKRDCKRW